MIAAERTLTDLGLVVSVGFFLVAWFASRALRSRRVREAVVLVLLAGLTLAGRRRCRP